MKSHWLKATIRLLPIVLGFSILSIVGLCAFRAIVPLEVLKPAGDAVGNYLQTVGGIYAVLLAFIVFVVWGQFNDSRGYVEREATAIVDLHRTASGLPAHTRDAIQRPLEAYIEDVLAREWAAMAHHDEDAIEKVGTHLELVWSAVHACKPMNDCQQSVFSEVLSRFNDLSDLRTNRLSTSRARVPLMMRLLLYAGGLITIVSIYFMAVEPFWIHAVMAGALGGVVAHIIYLIWDLDNAFAGNLQISKEAFERAKKTVQRRVHRVDAAA